MEEPLLEPKQKSNLLSRLNRIWLDKIKQAEKFKEEEFGKDAKELMKFYDGPHDFLWVSESGEEFSHDEQAINGPKIKITINLISNFVQLFLPVLYHRNPQREISHRAAALTPELLLPLVPPELLQLAEQQHNMQQEQLAQQAAANPEIDPATGMPIPFEPAPFDPFSILPPRPTELSDQIESELVRWYLNLTPELIGLKPESLQALTEALITGLGFLWQETVELPSETSEPTMAVASFYEPQENVIYDPDAKTVRDAKFVVRKRCRPIYEVARDYDGVTEEELRKAASKRLQKDTANIDVGEDRKVGHEDYDHLDQVEYYEVYSKMGMGSNLTSSTEMKQKLEAIDQFGDYCMIVVCEGLGRPLNIPEYLVEDDATEEILADLQARVSWPTPFYNNPKWGWPFAELRFHSKPGCLYPIAHCKPSLGYQKIIDYLYSFMISRASIVNRCLFVVDKHLSPDAKDILESGADLSIIEVQHIERQLGTSLVEFVTMPEVNNDWMKLLLAMEEQWDKGVGATDLLYGISNTQDRSATETQTKQQNLQIRPDYLSNRVDEFMSQAAQNEYVAIKEHVAGKDVAPLLGEPVPTDVDVPGFDATVPNQGLESLQAKGWDLFVYNPGNPMNGLRLECRVEAGSARRPDKATKIAQAAEAMQVIFPAAMQQYANTGNPTQVNELLMRWTEANDMKQIPPFMPMMPPQMPMQ